MWFLVPLNSIWTGVDDMVNRRILWNVSLMVYRIRDFFCNSHMVWYTDFGVLEVTSNAVQRPRQVLNGFLWGTLHLGLYRRLMDAFFAWRPSSLPAYKKNHSVSYFFTDFYFTDTEYIYWNRLLEEKSFGFLGFFLTNDKHPLRL